MLSRLLNRFSLQSENWNEYVILALIVIWLAVLGCIVSSILSQPFNRQQRIFWVAMVVLLPGVGVMAYLPFGFRKEDLPHIFQTKSKKRKHRKHPVTDTDT